MRKIIDRLSTNILRFLPALLVFLIPLFFLPITTDFFQVNKQFLLFVTASIALLFFCFRLITRGHIQLTLAPATLPLAGFTLITILSTFIKHPNPRYAITNSTAIAISLFIVFLATTSTQKTAIVIKSIIVGIVSSTVILGVFSILNHFDVISQLSVPEWMKQKLFNPSGSPYNYLTIAIPSLIAIIGMGITSRNWTIKPLLLASAIIITTGSIFSIKLLLPNAESNGIVLLPHSVAWSIAVDTFKNPKTALIGTGPDTFYQVYSRLKPASLNLDNNLWSIRFPSSSSEFLNVLTTTGILGLIFYVLVFFNTIKSLIKAKNITDPETIFILSGLIATAILFIFFPVNISTQVLGLAFLISASIKLKIESSSSTKDVQLSLSTKQISSAYSDSLNQEAVGLPVLPWILTVSSIVLLAVFWNFASKTYAANLAIFEASQSINDNQLKSYNKQIEASKLNPTDPYLKINLSQTYIAITKSLLTPTEGSEVTEENKTKALEFANQALNEAKQAANLAPYDVAVWENFASIARFLAGYKIEGAIDWTLSTYTQAISLDPTNPTLRVQLGTFYFYIGDLDQATKVMSQAIELKPNWNVPYYNISLVYKNQKQYQKALAYMEEAKKYTPTSNKEDLESIEAEITELKTLVPTPTPTPSPSGKPTPAEATPTQAVQE